MYSAQIIVYVQRYTALMEAAQNMRTSGLKAAERLLVLGAEVNAKDYFVSAHNMFHLFGPCKYLDVSAFLA